MRNKSYRILSILISLMSFSCTGAQVVDGFRRWEGEIFGGGNVTLGESSFLRHYETAKESKSLIGYTLGGEIRRNLENVPVDLGLRLSFSKTGHDVRWKANENSPSMWGKSYNNAFVLAAVGDWIFNREADISPFAGVGVGVALNEYLSRPTHLKPFLMPRVGIAFRHRVRLSVCANFSEESQNTLMLTVGYSFGLRPAPSKVVEMDPMKIQDHVNRLMRQSKVCLWSGVGALCLGLPTIGVGLAIIGIPAEGAAVLGGVIAGAGGVLTLSSIPLFIVSQKKKNEALRLSLQMSAMTQTNLSGAILSTPGIGLSFAF